MHDHAGFFEDGTIAKGSASEAFIDAFGGGERSMWRQHRWRVWRCRW